jgi:hypothetical protein
MRNRGKGTAVTVVRPHSIYEMKRSGRYQTRTARRVSRGGKKAFAAFQRWRIRTSTRAILRPELLARLHERVAEMAMEKLRW